MIDEYIQHLGITGQNANRLKNHLKKCEPFGENYEGIKAEYQSILKKGGDNKGERRYTDDYINKNVVKDYQKFVEWKKSKGEIIMTFENEIRNQGQSENIEPVKEENHLTTENNTSEVMNMTESVESSTKKGRPVSTGRTSKLTLYMQDQLMQDLSGLADLRKISLTDLINGVLERYTATQQEQIKALREIEMQKDKLRRELGIE